MIKANELRPNNYVLGKPISIPRMGIYSNGITQITAYGIYCIESGVFTNYDPIPLSPAILRDCGFEEDKVQNGFEYIKEIGDDGFYFQFGFYKAAQEWTVFKICGNGCYDDGG